VGAFAEVEADSAVEPGGGPVALAHDALDFFGCYDKRSFYHSLFFYFLSLWLGEEVLYVCFKYTVSILYVYFILVYSFVLFISSFSSVKIQRVVGDW
jgi:hypothetical protein